MSRIEFRLTAATDVGCVRTNNEDNFITNHDLSQSDWFVPQDVSQLIPLGKNGAILVVADGMGGLNAGEVASAIAVDTVKRYFMDTDLSDIAKSQKSIEKFMCKVVVDADKELKKHVKENPETKGMGTTIVIAWVYGDIAHIVWCGDSRAYVFNPNEGLMRLTKDHSYVQELVDAGKLDEDLAIDHPDSNIITRCLGDFRGKANPDYTAYRLKSGDTLMLCSDGLCGVCRDEEILQVMDEAKEDIEQCRKQLILCALKAGGYDNVTVALFETVTVESDETTSSYTLFDERNVRRIKLSAENEENPKKKLMNTVELDESGFSEEEETETPKKKHKVDLTTTEARSSSGLSNTLIIVLLLIILILIAISFFRN